MKKQTIKKWVQNLMPKRKQSSDENREQFEVQKYSESHQQWTSAQAQIINQLIQMDNLIKITKHLNYEEFISLNKINDVICLEQIQVQDSKRALLGGINIFDKYSNKRFITKQLPYQYYPIRSLLWKINIGYLNRSAKQKWISTMQKSNVVYRQYVNQFIVQKKQRKLGILHIQQIQKKPKLPGRNKDHPLNFSGQSKWKSHFTDVDIWNSIQKDIKRTRKSSKFFDQISYFFEVEQINLKPEQLRLSDQQKGQTYQDALTRILFIYIKKHPQQLYIQGMNQIIALIFYCFTNKNSEYMRRVSQSDAYFIFEMVLAKFPKKHFQRGEEYAKKFIELLKKIDLRFFEGISNNLMLQNFRVITIRWFLTGFLSQFEIDDALLIWDFVICLSDTMEIMNTFMYLALAIVHLNRNKILEGENLLIIFSKIEQAPFQIVQKALNLHKIFPKIMEP